MGASEIYAEDGVFIDPHYPEPEYRGPDEVREAPKWALEHVVEQPGLTIRNVWEDGESFAAEVDTHHTMQDGTEAEFPRVFIIETENGQSPGGSPISRSHRPLMNSWECRSGRKMQFWLA